MSEPDEAAWIAAAGAPRSDDFPADRDTVRSDGWVHGGADRDDTDHDDSDHDDTDRDDSDRDDSGEATISAADPIAEPVPAADRPVDAPAPDEPGPSGAEGVVTGPAVAASSSPALRALRGRDPVPEPLATHGPAVVLAMCNQKGGVGKTTSTINLGAALAEYGRRVLMVDLDPQGALSAGLGIAAHELDHTIYNLMLGPSTAMTDVLMPTRIEGVDLIPANIDLSAAEVQLINEVGREHTLSRALRPVLHAYDYVLIDCQPSLGLLTVNALACAQGVIIPLAAEFFSLRGVALLVDTITKVKERINPDLSVHGVLVTMYDGRTMHARDVVAMLHQRFGDQVYDTIISRTVKFPETTVAGEPITSYASSSPGAAAYRQLAKEVLAR